MTVAETTASTEDITRQLETAAQATADILVTIGARVGMTTGITEVTLR